MKDFIYKNLKYPKQALKEKVEGMVMLRVDIDHNGKVVNAKITKSLNQECDEEAQRVVSLLKFDIPKTPRKLRVIFHKNLKVQFILPKEKPAPVDQLSYQYVEKKKTNKKEEVLGKKQIQKKSDSYNYTINW